MAAVLPLPSPMSTSRPYLSKIPASLPTIRKPYSPFITQPSRTLTLSLTAGGAGAACAAGWAAGAAAGALAAGAPDAGAAGAAGRAAGAQAVKTRNDTTSGATHRLIGGPPLHY